MFVVWRSDYTMVAAQSQSPDLAKNRIEVQGNVAQRPTGLLPAEGHGGNSLHRSGVLAAKRMRLNRPLCRRQSRQSEVEGAALTIWALALDADLTAQFVNDALDDGQAQTLS